jgi:DNA invertase Pin-like site-specific DNA recombinase
MRVYTYARYSTERQTEASIVDQQRRCHQYAQSREWQVAADFTDEGISGAALGNRPGFQQAMAALQGGDVLLAADLTRLSRSRNWRRCSIGCGSAACALLACSMVSTAKAHRPGCKPGCQG